MKTENPGVDKNLKRLESDKTEKSNRRRAKPRRSVTLGFLILLLPISLFAQIFTDTTKWNESNLQRVGPWQMADFGAINVFDNTDMYLKYEFYGFGISVYTFRDVQHGGYIIDVDGKIDTVNCFKESRQIYRTYFDHHLDYGNHVIIIRPYPASKTFIFERFVTYTDSDPNQIHYYLNGDTVKLPNDTIPGITIKLPNDTIQGEVIQLPDITIPGDTIKGETVYINDTTLVAVERSDIYVNCKETNCPDFDLKNIQLLLYLLAGLMVIGFVASILIKRI